MTYSFSEIIFYLPSLRLLCILLLRLRISGKGIVLQEPSVVAMDLEEGVPLAVGDDAKLMLGRTPGNIRAVRPLRDGVIADFDAAEQMLKTFIQKCNEGRGIIAPRLVIPLEHFSNFSFGELAPARLMHRVRRTD